MVPETLLHEDLMFPPEPTQRSLARRFYGAVRDLPIISPHGHTDPKWFALNKPFPDKRLTPPSRTASWRRFPTLLADAYCSRPKCSSQVAKFLLIGRPKFAKLE